MAEEFYYTSESHLWEDFLKGDLVALRTIYNNNIQQLFRYGCNFTNDQDLVKDCIHDIFIELHKYREHLSSTSNIKRYLFKALKNCIVKKLVKQNKTYQLNDTDTSFFYTPSFEEELINNELHSFQIKEVEKALSLFTNRQKEAIYLRFISELDYEEIGHVMNLNYQSARNLVYRGLEKLRESCRKKGIKHFSTSSEKTFFERSR